VSGAAPISVEAALARARERLAGRGESPALDAEVLLAHVIGRNRAWLRAFGERELGAAEAARFEALVARRAAGEPVAHLTGRREFWSLELEVTPATLIPRPDTELLVEAALARLPDTPGLRVADLGTGSGAVALALAAERPGWRLLATDRSTAALAVARRNAGRLGLVNVAFRAGDWCAALDGEPVDAILSNPPYIPAADPHLGRGDLAHEPRAALTPGPGGLEAIERIARESRAHLRPGGWLLIEHGYDQGKSAVAVLEAAGYTAVEDLEDTAGNPRVVCGRQP